MKNGQFTLLEIELKKAIAAIREDIARSEKTNSITFRITASGRVDGDLILEFNLENQFDNKCNVTGGNLQAVVVEFLRQTEWNHFNQPLCLPPVGEAVPKAPVEDEIPF